MIVYFYFYKKKICSNNITTENNFLAGFRSGFSFYVLQTKLQLIRPTQLFVLAFSHGIRINGLQINNWKKKKKKKQKRKNSNKIDHRKQLSCRLLHSDQFDLLCRSNKNGTYLTYSGVFDLAFIKGILIKTLKWLQLVHWQFCIMDQDAFYQILWTQFFQK